MADLTKKTRYCNICIRKDKYYEGFDDMLRDYVNEYCERYTYIKHDKDINTKGELEGTHYHLVVIFKKNQRLCTRLNDLCAYFHFDNPFGIQIDKTISNTQSVQYLIHKNNKEKTQHSIDEVVCNYDRSELKLIMDSDHDDVITFDYIIELLYEKNSLIDVIKYLGLNGYRTYRNVITDIIRSTPNLKAKFYD